MWQDPSHRDPNTAICHPIHHAFEFPSSRLRSAIARGELSEAQMIWSHMQRRQNAVPQHSPLSAQRLNRPYPHRYSGIPSSFQHDPWSQASLFLVALYTNAPISIFQWISKHTATQECNPIGSDQDAQAIRDHKGNGIISLAAFLGRLDLLQPALSFWTERDTPTSQVRACANPLRQTPLHLACANGQLHVVKFLLDYVSGSPDERDQSANTALHYASAWGHRSIVSLLLSRGADPQARNASGHTSAELAFDEDLRLRITQHLALGRGDDRLVSPWAQAHGTHHASSHEDVATVENALRSVFPKTKMKLHKFLAKGRKIPSLSSPSSSDGASSITFAPSKKRSWSHLIMFPSCHHSDCLTPSASHTGSLAPSDGCSIKPSKTPVAKQRRKYRKIFSFPHLQEETVSPGPASSPLSSTAQSRTTLLLAGRRRS